MLGFCRRVIGELEGECRLGKIKLAMPFFRHFCDLNL